MKKGFLVLCFGLVAIVLLAVLSGCIASGSQKEEAKPDSLSSEPLSVVSATAVPIEDLCSKENRLKETEKIVKSMQYFDDLSVLAQSAPREQLVPVLLALYQVRAEVRSREVPQCLEKLHKAQINFMDGVIVTLNNFLAGGGGDSLAMLIAATRNLRTEYEVELGNQLGYKYETPTPLPTFTPTPVTPTATPAQVTAYTEKDIYLLSDAYMEANRIGVFLRGQLGNVLGKSLDSNWVVIEVADKPGVVGWAPIAAIHVNGSIEPLPMLQVVVPTATLPVIIPPQQ